MSWEELMKKESENGTLGPIKEKLEEAYAHSTVYPARENLFRALDMTPMDQVKVVILGQDPYHEPGQAQGFSFSVPAKVKTPPSLVNIYKELAEEYGQVKVVILGQDPYHEPGQAQGFSFSVPAKVKTPPSLVNIYKELAEEYGQPVNRSGDLSDWAAQGVLLLNSILSVEQGKPLSHAGFGWQTFTNDILKELNTLDQPIVFLLWGAQARKAKEFLNNPNHLVLESPHPSPLSASRGFFHNGHFRMANEFLESKGVEGIDWIRNNRQ